MNDYSAAARERAMKAEEVILLKKNVMLSALTSKRVSYRVSAAS